jgi:hypothetical protein
MPPLLVGFLLLSSSVPAVETGGTTLVTPPWTHCLGLHKVGQFHLDLYSGYREKFVDPEGLFCTKLVSEDNPETSHDDDELTVFGVNSGNSDIIYNKSLTSIGIVGRPGAGKMEFRNPRSLTGDKMGNLYVADSGNDRIVQLRYVDKELVWVGEIDGGAGGPFSMPSGIALSGGLLYVADTGNDRIVALRADGTFAGSMVPEFKGARLWKPSSIAAVTEGDEWLYYRDYYLAVTDSLGQRLWKVSPDGRALVLVRRGDLGGMGSFDHIAIDYYGNIYVTDRENGCIHKFDRHGVYVAAIGGTGPDDIHLDQPRGIAIYRRFGQLFVDERAGAQYFWIGTDLLRFEASNLTFSPDGKRCSVDVSFLLTEHSDVSLSLVDDRGKNRFTIISDYLLPLGKFSRRIAVDCPDGAALAKCNLRVVVTAKPTYSSRAFLAVRRESRPLTPQISPLSSR